MTHIALGGFGAFEDDPEGLTQLKEAAERYGLEFYETYYDHELKGDRATIEALTKDLWGMPADQWVENNLSETVYPTSL